MKKCLYCNAELSPESVIDFCQKCGKGVWGDKMFNTIVKNMEDARENGDLCNSRDDGFQEQKQEIPDQNPFSL